MARVIRNPSAVIAAPVFDARQEASRIRSEAEAEAQAIRERAKTEGLALARAEAAVLLLRAESERQRALQDAEAEVTEIGLLVARKILGHQLEVDPSHVRSIAKAAIERVRRATAITIRVHPSDVKEIEALKAEGTLPVSLADVLDISPDDRIERGGCVVSSNVGTIDARLSVQLDVVAQLLSQTRS